MYDRNTVLTKWAVYGPYTTVIRRVPVGYVIGNNRSLPFTIVESIAWVIKKKIEQQTH